MEPEGSVGTALRGAGAAWAWGCGTQGASSAIAMGVPGMLMPASLVRAGTAAGFDSLRGALENGAGVPAEAADAPVGVGPRVEARLAVQGAAA